MTPWQFLKLWTLDFEVVGKDRLLMKKDHLEILLEDMTGKIDAVTDNLAEHRRGTR